MDKLDKIENVLLALTFIVPGFLIYSVLSLFTVRRTEIKEVLFLRYLSFSTLNLVVCLVPIYGIIKSKLVENNPWLAFLAFFGMCFVSPLLLGLLISLADNYKWLEKLFTKGEMAPMSATPSAWDEKFKQAAKSGGRYLLVYLKDGSEVAGDYGSKGVASTDPLERDIYLDKLYKLDDNEQWVLQPCSDGVLIKGDMIQAVEFFYDAEPLLQEEPTSSENSKDNEVPSLIETEQPTQ